MPQESVHFFTGENSYGLEHEVQRWKKTFVEKHGVENYLEIHGKTATLSELLDAVSAMPFIAEKRLILIRGLPSIDREGLQVLADAVHPQAVVLIVESKPDKRLGITKAMLDLADTKEFKSLGPSDLFSWAERLVSVEGSRIDRKTFDHLVTIVGTDQWTLDAELRKLSSASTETISKELVDLMAVPSGEQVIWRLTDLVGTKKFHEAIAFLRSQIERGEDPYGLWVILLNMIKNVVLVWSGLDAGLRDERSISSAFGIHFLAVRGLLPLAKSLDRRRVTAILEWASEADIALKTGGYHYASERQGELIALAERVILQCSAA